jgi:hypothetical protein
VRRPKARTTCRPPLIASDDPSINTLEAKLLAGVGSDAALDAARAELGVRVRDALEGPTGGRVGGAPEADVVDHGVADAVAVGRVDGLGSAVLEDGRLDEELGAHAGVDAGADGGEVAAVFGGMISCGQQPGSGGSGIGGQKRLFASDSLEDVAGAESE